MEFSKRCDVGKIFERKKNVKSTFCRPPTGWVNKDPINQLISQLKSYEKTIKNCRNLFRDSRVNKVINFSKNIHIKQSTSFDFFLQHKIIENFRESNFVLSQKVSVLCKFSKKHSPFKIKMQIESNQVYIKL